MFCDNMETSHYRLENYSIGAKDMQEYEDTLCYKFRAKTQEFVWQK